MFTVVVTFHVLVCISLILVVLLQSSSGSALGGSAFGGGGGGGSFGGSTRSGGLPKLTTILAVVFMLNCLALAVLSSGKQSSATGQPDPDARSVVTEQMQRELDARAARQATQPAAIRDTGRTFPPDPISDSLVKILRSVPPPAEDNPADTAGN